MQTSDNAYWSFPLRGIEMAEKELSQYRVAIRKFFFSLKNEATFVKASNKLIDTHPDAVLVAPVFRKEAERFLERCDMANIPYIFVDSSIPGKKNIGYFGQDARQSGFLAAKLMNLGLEPRSEILVVNFVSKLDNHPHFRDRENGFRQYFSERKTGHMVHRISVSPDNETRLPDLLAVRVTDQTRGIFVTSGAHKVARLLPDLKKNKLCCIGYDLTHDNLECLRNYTIQFLICQKPVSQGYQGLMALFDHFVNHEHHSNDRYMPLEIITQENVDCYLENEP
jgi:LacI family transcriptional regulator